MSCVIRPGYHFCAGTNKQEKKRIVAFFTGREDLAHISFLQEAVPNRMRQPNIIELKFFITNFFTG